MIDAVASIALAISTLAGFLAAGVGATSTPGIGSVRASRVLALGAAAAVVAVITSMAGAKVNFASFELRTFTGLVLLLIVGMGATVAGYATRSLRCELYQRHFTVTASCLIGVGAIFATTNNMIVAAGAWIGTSWLAVALIRTGPELGKRNRSWRAERSFLVSDIAVAVAIAVLVTSTGSTDLADLGSASKASLAIAGLLLVIAATARSAAGPFTRWLPDSLGAPTASSALLHAGVVNGGAILLIKFSPAITGNWWAAIAATAIGGLTCIFAEAVMLTRSDIKGRLAWSTIAQMSFTIAMCGLGLHIAAGLHLVAHGFYKGAMFLGSGSAVRGMTRQRSSPPRMARNGFRSRMTTTWGYVTIGAAIIALLQIADQQVTAEIAVPLLLLWIAGGRATSAALQRSHNIRYQLQTALLGASMASSFVILTLALKRAVSDDITVESAVQHPLWIAPIFAGLLLVAAAHRSDDATHPMMRHLWDFVQTAGRPAPVNAGRPKRAQHKTAVQHHHTSPLDTNMIAGELR